MFLKLCGDKRLCVRDGKFMALLFCEVRRYSLMLALNLGVVGVKAEGCNRPLLRLCMASEREEQKKQVSPKERGQQVRLDALVQDTSLEQISGLALTWQKLGQCKESRIIGHKTGGEEQG